MSKLEVDKIDPQSGTDLELGTSGDTITIPTGVTLDASNATTTLPATVVTTTGSQTLTNKSIDASQLTGTITPSDNTVSLAKLTATGTKDATTFLRGDNTFDTPPGAGITNAQQFRLTADLTGNNSTQYITPTRRVADNTGYAGIGSMYRKFWCIYFSINWIISSNIYFCLEMDKIQKLCLFIYILQQIIQHIIQ
jgi:hypothetical protein